MKSRLQRVWMAWKELAGTIGDFQARALLTAFYFTLLVPFTLIARLQGDPLQPNPRRSPRASGWIKRTSENQDPAGRAQRQF